MVGRESCYKKGDSFPSSVFDVRGGERLEEETWERSCGYVCIRVGTSSGH